MIGRVHTSVGYYDKLHWRTEKIVEKAVQYVLRETGNDIEDFLYCEVGADAESEMQCRYADEETYWSDVNPDVFTEDDWDDIEYHIMYEAENYVDFYKEQKEYGYC